MPSREGFGWVFDEDPELYDRARPSYPDELFRDLAELSGLRAGSVVVEIGPGTGQATSGLLDLGVRVVAIEPGARLAGMLRDRYADRSLDVVVSRFEDWRPAEPVDVVAAFTAWHWVDAAVRSRRVADVLAPGGALVTVTTEHVAGGSQGPFEAAERCYERWDPVTSGDPLRAADDIPPIADEVDADPAFEPAVRRRHLDDVTYTTAEYLSLIRTYSAHQALSPEARAGLEACLAGLLDAQGGHVTKRYLRELRVARRAGH